MNLIGNIINHANETSARVEAADKESSVRHELTKFIKSRGREASHLQGAEIVAVHKSLDRITFITSENAYVHIEMVNDDPHDTDTFELECGHLSVEDAVEFGIVSADMYAPLKEAEDEERQRQKCNTYERVQAEKAKWLKEYLATAEGIGAAITIFGVEETKKILKGMKA